METTEKTGLRKATRQKAKIKLGLSGPSGSGKTYSALLIANGMTPWNKIAIIDTENGSADLYADMGDYNVLPITPPYSPENYIESIYICEKSGIEVIIIDSITHEWNGKGGCLEIHEQETQKMRIPNSFTAWSKVTPRHQSFIDKILQTPCHIITTVRSKQDYILTDKNGKQTPQKIGLSAVTRDGFEYELTLSLDIDIEHKAMAGKDRTGLFMDAEKFIPNKETGKKILDWCEQGAEIKEETMQSIPMTKLHAPLIMNGMPAVVSELQEKIIYTGIKSLKENFITSVEMDLNKEQLIKWAKEKGLDEEHLKKLEAQIKIVINEKRKTLQRTIPQ